MGHFTSLELVARQLSDLASKQILVAPEGVKKSGNLDVFDEIIEFPSAQSLASHSVSRTEELISYNSQIRAFGFCDPKFVFTRLKLWQKLYDNCSPGLFIGDYAPMAVLTARKLGIPTMVTGNGYTLPPINIRKYPRFFNRPDPVNDQQILEATNQALRLAGMVEISTVPEIFASDIHACFTNPLFDPFGKIRKPKALGALLNPPHMVHSSTPDEKIFVYLTNCNQAKLELILETLRELDIPTDLYSFQFGEVLEELSRGSNVNVLEHPISQEEICKNYSLAIHLGGHRLMMELLESGIPQLVLPIDMEKIVHAHAMAKLNYVHQLRLDRPVSRQELLDKIKQALRDETMSASLRQYVSSREIRDYDEGLKTVREEVKRLLFKSD